MKTKSNKTITKYVKYLPMKELLTYKNTIGFKSLKVLEQCYDYCLFVSLKVLEQCYDFCLFVSFKVLEQCYDYCLFVSSKVLEQCYYYYCL